MKYYIISTEDVGPNAKPNNKKIEIRTEPGTTNQGGEIKLSGWLGTTNDYAKYAYGEYNSLKEACSFIAKEYPEYDENIDLNDEYDEELILIYTEKLDEEDD